MAAEQLRNSIRQEEEDDAAGINEQLFCMGFHLGYMFSTSAAHIPHSPNLKFYVIIWISILYTRLSI
jgi:hypothetical protein